MAGVIIFVNWLKASMSTLLPSGVLMMGAEPMSSGCNDRKGRGIELSNTGTYRKWTITETKVWHSKSSFPSKARRRPEIQQDTSSKQAWSPVIKREKRKDEKLKLEEDQSREASLISPSVGSLLTRVIHWYLNVISYFIFFKDLCPSDQKKCDVKDRAKKTKPDWGSNEDWELNTAQHQPNVPLWHYSIIQLSSSVYTFFLTQRAESYTNTPNKCRKHSARRFIKKKKKTRDRNGSSWEFERAFLLDKNINKCVCSAGSYLGFLHPHCTLVRSTE